MVTQNQEMPMTPLERVDEPDMGTGLIDPTRYTDPEFAKLEWERMWTKTWNIAGGICDIPEVGDYFTHTLGRESFIFIRTGEDEIKGYYNICPHRGSRLRPSVGMGHAEQLQCPFHLWTFNIEGELHTVPDRQHFVNGIPEDKQRLTEIRVDTWGPFVFFNMDDEAESLTDFLGVIPSHLDPYHFEEYHLVQDYQLIWDCNWKFAVDQFAEIYHLPALHPQLIEWWDTAGTPLDVYDGGRHSRQLIRQGYPDGGAWTDEMARRHGYTDKEMITDSQWQQLAAVGIEQEEFEGGVNDVRPAIIEARRDLYEAMGVDVSALHGEQLIDDYHYMIFPNITLNIGGTSLTYFRARPHPTNPDQCLWDYQTYVRLPEGTPIPPRPQTVRGTAHDVEVFEALGQDMAQAQIVQESYHSKGFSGILLNSEERRVRAMHYALEQYLFGPDR
jgi:phenylpropionate dioxygenase-like ring-hydroxylating dioxygenase large terminal subunit